MQRIVLALAVTSALALSGCKKNPPEELPPPPVTTSTQAPATTAPTTGTTPGTQDHFREQMRGQDVIYFDTDTYDVDSEDQAALRTQAQYLTQFANVRATIEGHADERGTRDYNLALGERRANSARDYLVSQGVPTSRLLVTSWGKEKCLSSIKRLI